MSDFALRRDVYLMLTEQCPCSCDYCYIKDRTNPYTMSLDTVDKIMKESNPKRIIFFGGEPMLRPDLIEGIMNKYPDIKYQIITSGLVNFDRLIEIDNKFGFNEVQISYDGEGIMSRHCNGEYITPLQNALKLAKLRQVDVKCVINEKNVSKMYDIHKEFIELKKHNIQGEFVIAHVPKVSNKFIKDFKKNIKLCLSVDGKTYTEFLNKILAIKKKSKSFSSCDAGHYVVYRPNGDKHYCTILSQYEYFDADELTRECFSDNCKNCKYRILCDGGCRYERYINFGEEWRNHHLASTCRIVEAYYETITDWLGSLNEIEHNKLNQTLLKYIQYQKEYSGG